jgi:hypothetical protein
MMKFTGMIDRRRLRGVEFFLGPAGVGARSPAPSRRSAVQALMENDADRIDGAVLALLFLGRHGKVRTWKSFDCAAMERLHAKGDEMRATRFLMKRLPQVATEMALHVLAYNLTRVMNIIGIQPLLAVIRA